MGSKRAIADERFKDQSVNALIDAFARRRDERYKPVLLGGAAADWMVFQNIACEAIANVPESAAFVRVVLRDRFP